MDSFVLRLGCFPSSRSLDKRFREKEGILKNLNSKKKKKTSKQKRG
jgi:hypothetical protein